MSYLKSKSKKQKLCNSVVSVILTIAILLSVVVTIPAFAGNEVEIWDGTVADAFSVGDGSVANPYEISDGSELALAIKSGGNGKNYKLTADIYLNDTQKIDWSTGNAIGNYQINQWYDNVAFEGSIDGNGHTVYGLYRKNEGSAFWYYEGVGLIPRVNVGSTVVISSLGIDNAYVRGLHGASAFVGFSGVSSAISPTTRATVKISQSFVGENVTVYGNDAGAMRGGARGADFTFTDCYSLATVNGSSTAGFIGNDWNTSDKIINCYNAKGTMAPEVYTGSVTFANSYQTVSGSYSDGVYTISSDKMQCEDVFENTEKMLLLNANEKFMATSDYPIISDFYRENNDSGNNEETYSIWNGQIATGFALGDGSATSPYEITNGAELALAISSNDGKYYKIVKDIYLNDVTKIDWTTGVVENGYVANQWFDHSKNFAGTIDGNGHIVYGLYYNDNSTRKYPNVSYGVGLIPSVVNGNTANINNLGIEQTYINYECGVGGFVGLMKGEAKVNIDKCYVGETVTLIGAHTGAFRGKEPSESGTTTLTNCYSLATVIATPAVDAGQNYGTTKVNGALLGNNLDYVVVKNSFNAKGALLLDTKCYGLTASGNYQTENGYSSVGITTVSAEQMKGEEALTNMPNLNSESAFVTTESYPELSIFVRDSSENPPVQEGQIWNGQIATGFASGAGNANDPFIVTNGAELALAISSNQGNYYKLANDIYLNDITKINWTTGVVEEDYVANQWFDHSKDFAGTIDGNGYVVYGLYYNDNSTRKYPNVSYGVGLVPSVINGNTANIQKLGIENSYINYECAVGGFVGLMRGEANVNIDRCYVGETVTLIGAHTGAFRGKEPSEGGTTTLTNCYSLATVIASPAVDAGQNYGTTKVNGALLGNNLDYVVVKNSFNVKGALLLDTKCYGLTAFGNYQTADGYSNAGITTVTEAQMKGEEALTNMPELNSEGAFVTTEGYPQIDVFSDAPIVPDNPNPPEQPEPETPSWVWNGQIATGFASGTGSANDPFIVTNGAELALAISSNQGNYYKLANDIYLNDTSKIDWNTGVVEDSYVANQWFDHSKDFAGTIDGNGYVVYGLYYNDNSTTKYPGVSYGVGLIPSVINGNIASIRNLGIENGYINYECAVGGFVGLMRGGANVSIDRCYLGETVTLIGAHTGAFRGKEPSENGTTTLTNCYSLATVTASPTLDEGKNYATAKITGALLGNNLDYVVVKNSFNVKGALLLDTKCYGLTAFGNYQTSDGYSNAGITTVTEAQMKGEEALTNMPDLNSEGAFVATDNYPEIDVFSGNSVTPKPPVTETPGQVWTGDIATGFSSGTGAENNPFIISTASELAYAVINNGFSGKYFKLSHDIYLNDVSYKMWYNNSNNKEWVVATRFGGHIDGDGHIVYGMYFSEDSENKYAGLISNLVYGSIKNIGVRYAQVSAVAYAGGIVGKTSAGEYKLIENCFADETVFVDTTAITAGSAGIVGMAEDMTNYEEVSLSIKNCYSKAKLTALFEHSKNGILGHAWRTPYEIKNCYSVGYPVYTAKEGAVCTSAYWNYYPGEINEARSGKKLEDYVSNNYCDVGETNEWTVYTVISDSKNMREESAKIFMSGLDFDNVYQVVKGGTPKLKIFASIDGKDISTSKESDFFGGGSGTPADPFVIKTVEHLRYVVESRDTKGKYYKLGNDIYVNDTKSADWKNNNPAVWYSHTDQEHHFAGILDGDGHAIYGLYVNEKPNPTEAQKKEEYISKGTGLFPYLNSSAQIRNLHIRDSYIFGEGCVGAFAGSVLRGKKGEAAQFIACSVDESVTINGYTVGGIVGAANQWIDLTYCYSTAKMTCEGAANRLNGLVGDIWSAKLNILQCYTIGYPVVFGSISTVDALYTTVEHTGATLLTKEQMTGNNAKKYMTGFDWDKAWYTENGKTPQLKVIPYGQEEFIYDEGVKNRVWSGKVATGFAGGTGTVSDPYLIETPEQLAYLITNGSGEGKNNYKLTADIKLNDTSKADWQKSAKQWFAGMSIFRGVFDGNGHIVSGLYYNNTQKTTGDAVGLFQRLGYDSKIMRLGIVESTIISKGDGVETFAGAFVGWLEHWEPELNPDRTAPLISECFADDTVYIEATMAGGILGGTPTVVHMENCYFTGELTGEATGALVGDAWGGIGHRYTNCYGATLDRDPIGSGSVFGANAVSSGSTILKNVYVDGPSAGGGAQPLSIMYMKDTSVAQRMTGFDFNSVWLKVKGGTPVLRCFANAEKYACTRDAKKVSISFSTAGGSKCDAIYGYPGFTKITPDMIPTPTRYGYVFEGWHHFNEYGMPFELDVFPNYDIGLVASWKSMGFEINFEQQLDNIYDYNDGIEIFTPGVAGYSVDYIRSGWRSLHTIKDSAVSPMFLLSYDNKLEVGKEYELTIWLNTNEQGTKGVVDFLYVNNPDVRDNVIGYRTAFEFANLKVGEWTEYRVKFIAAAPYIILRASNGCSVFFEDIQVAHTGITGEPDKLSAVSGFGSSNNNGLNIIFVVIGAVLVLAGATITTIIILKKKKQNKSVN